MSYSEPSKRNFSDQRLGCQGLSILAKIIAADISRAFDESKYLEEKMHEIMKDERFMAALK